MIYVVGLHNTGLYANGKYGWIASTINHSCVIDIPLFFMVSGYLLLGRKNIDYKYFFRKIFAILKFVLLITLCMYALSYVRRVIKQQECNIDFTIIINTWRGGFLQEGSLWMFWYFGAMIIIYLLYPIINKLYNLDSKVPFTIFILAMFIIESIVFSVNLAIGKEKGQPFEMYMIQSFRIWNWILYFVIGGFIKMKEKVRLFIDIKKYIFLSITILAIANVVFQNYFSYFMNSESYQCEYFYSFLVVIMLSILIFIAIVKVNIKENRIISELSVLFLPMYTIHIYVINVARSHFDISVLNGFASIVLWATVSVASIIASFIIMKIPLIKKIFKL